MQKANLEQFLTVSLHTITFDVRIIYLHIKKKKKCNSFDILNVT